MDLRDSEIEEIFGWNAGRLSTADLEMFARIATSEMSSSLGSLSPIEKSDQCDSESEPEAILGQRIQLHRRVTHLNLQKEVSALQKQIKEIENELWHPHNFIGVGNVCSRCLLPLSELSKNFVSPQSYMASYHPLQLDQSCREF